MALNENCPLGQVRRCPLRGYPTRQRTVAGGTSKNQVCGDHLGAGRGLREKEGAMSFGERVSEREAGKIRLRAAVVSGYGLLLAVAALLVGCGGGVVSSTPPPPQPSKTPTIVSFSPTSGATGTSISVAGTNLNGATSVSFGGVAATTFAAVSATSVTATVPSAAVTGKISIVTPQGTATSTSDFTVSVAA